MFVLLFEVINYVLDIIMRSLERFLLNLELYLGNA